MKVCRRMIHPVEITVLDRTGIPEAHTRVPCPPNCPAPKLELFTRAQQPSSVVLIRHNSITSLNSCSVQGPGVKVRKTCALSVLLILAFLEEANANSLSNSLKWICFLNLNHWSCPVHSQHKRWQSSAVLLCAPTGIGGQLEWESCSVASQLFSPQAS